MADANQALAKRGNQGNLGPNGSPLRGPDFPRPYPTLEQFYRARCDLRRPQEQAGMERAESEQRQ